MMRRLYGFMKQRAWGRAKRDRCFLLCNMLLAAMEGGLVWIVAGRWLLPGLEWLFCFIGYPVFFLGFVGGILFLGRQDS